MSDNINLEAAKAAIMIDLGPERQDDLPLSNVTKSGRPSFEPRGNNGTSHYSNGRKADLKNKWGCKIEDKESQQMEGLKNEATRPWAPNAKQAPHQSQVESSKSIDHAPDPPASSTRRIFDSSAQSQGAASHVKFKTTTPARWGPSKSTAACTSNSQDPSPAVNTNSTSNGALPSTTPENGASSLLTFTKNDVVPENGASELVVASGECYIVPGKNRALSFVSKIRIKFRIAENEGILELYNNSKGHRIHNVLDIDTLVHDGDFCVVKVKSRQGPDHLRFSTVEEAQTFKRCLSKVQKTIRVHRQGTNETQSGNGVQEGNEDAKVSSTAPEEPLIEMGDDWGGVDAAHKPPMEQTTGNLVKLVNVILAGCGSSQPRSAGIISGIVDAICEDCRSEGAFDQAKEAKVKESVINVFRSMDQLQSIVHSREPGVTGEVSAPTAENVVEQTKRSTNRPGRKVTQGLSASRFATRPVAFEGNFTGSGSAF